MKTPPDISAPDISVSDSSASEISAYDGAVTPPMQDLLRAADPDADPVATYLARGQIYICGAADAPYGLMVLLSHALEGAHIWEAEKYYGGRASGQGRGLGFAGCRQTGRAQRGGAHALMIGTGNSSLAQLRLYQRLGFRIVSIVPDFLLIIPNRFMKTVFCAASRCGHIMRLTRIERQER